jgi:pyruvate dehydrogenase E2 component (dihydrolipoamide acetyltransferase)
MASESSEPPKSEPPPPNKEEPKQETEEASPIEEADPSGGPKEKPAEQGRQPTKGTTSALATPADQTKYGSGNARTEAAKAPEKPGQGEKPKFFASPLARKIALERGIPLGQIKGSGPEGRIVKVSGSTLVTLSLSDMEGDAEINHRTTSRTTKAALAGPVERLPPRPPPHPVSLPHLEKLLPLRPQSTRMCRSAACVGQLASGCWTASSRYRTIISP